MNNTIKSFNEVLKPGKVNELEGYQQLEVINHSLNYEVHVYIQKNKSKVPKWIKFLEDDVDIIEKESLMNTVNSFIIIVKIDTDYSNNKIQDRYFVITGGMGFTAINRDNIESDFGLKVVLNSINPNSIRGLDVRNIDTKTKQTRVHISKGSKLGEFEIDLSQDILNFVSGVSRFDELGKSMSGTASLSLSSNVQFSQLGDKCRLLLDLYNNENYKEEFGSIDNLKIVKQKTLIDTLVKEVLKRIKDKDEDISLVFPDMIEYDKCTHYRVQLSKSKYLDFHDIDILKIYKPELFTIKI